MWLKGDISIILEFAKKDWDAVPFGVAFGNTFVGVVIFKKRDAEQRRVPDPAEQKCPSCDGKGELSDLYSPRTVICKLCKGTGISNRSAGG